LKVAKYKIVTPKEKARKMECGTLSLEVKGEGDQKAYIIVFKTIRPLYIGNIVHSSKVKRVEEKAHKHQLKVAQVWRDPADGKTSMSFCTINFNKFEDMTSFEAEFKKAYESLPKPAK
jgi:hypothetical protein